MSQSQSQGFQVPREIQESLQRELSQFGVKTTIAYWGVRLDIPIDYYTVMDLTPGSFGVYRNAKVGLLHIRYNDDVAEAMIGLYLDDGKDYYYIQPAKPEIRLEKNMLSVRFYTTPFKHSEIYHESEKQ